MKQANLHLTDLTTPGNPGAFQMTIVIHSSNGKTMDITQLVDTFEVTESIFQQAMIAEISIADGTNLFEELNITGNEKIQVGLRKQLEISSPYTQLQSDWYILDIPLYARPKPDIQAYKIRCVSAFGLVSKMRRVEHILKGTASDIIKRLYEEIGIPSTETQLQDYHSYLNSGDVRKLLVGDVNTVGTMSYVPTKPTYSDAIQQMLSKTAAANGSPFFAYETFINGQHILNSYNNMITTPQIDNYVQGYFYNQDALSEDSFEEKRKRILEISSNIGFSPYKGFRDGSYVTRTHSVDWATKQYQIQDFNAFRDLDKNTRMAPDLVLHPDFSVSGIDYTNTPDSHTLFYSTNIQARSDKGEVNIHAHMPYVGPKRRSIISNLSQIEHIVTLHGDPRLIPGVQIGLVIPKAGFAESTDPQGIDELLSGRYLIVSSIHTFDNNGYRTKLKVVRDSIDRGGLPSRSIEGSSGTRYFDESSETIPQITNVIGQDPEGPVGGLNGEATASTIDIVPGYDLGEVDPALAAAVANSATIAGDIAQRQSDNPASVTSDQTGAAVGLEAQTGDIDTNEPPSVSGVQSGTIVDEDASASITKILDVGPGYNIVRLSNGKVVKRVGARNWRNNNPGNIKEGGYSKSKGSLGGDPSFAIFPSYSVGRQAKYDLIFSSSSYKDLKISEAITRYAPADDGNNTQSYARTVISAAAVPSERGGPDAIMKDTIESERTRILDAMEKVEGFKVGTVTELTGYV